MSAALSLDDVVRSACAAVGVKPPKNRLREGQWTRTDTDAKNGRNDASVKLDEDGRGGVVKNHQTGLSQQFRVGELSKANNDNNPELERQRRERDRQKDEERRLVARVCEAVISHCREDRHAYFDKKGFPDELGLVIDDPRPFFPRSRFGDAMAAVLPESDGKPLLVIPGRINGKVATVQFINSVGDKKNILKGQMGGAYHRIATGRDTWVCEGIGTALTVRAALRMLGANATVLSAFSASNVGKVAEAINGSRIAADHDKPVETLDHKGAGDFYARKSGRKWVMPPDLGDWNDHHTKHGLRAVALLLREAMG